MHTCMHTHTGLVMLEKGQLRVHVYEHMALYIIHENKHTHVTSHHITYINSNWPTFPQVYINGELLGGADIMLQLHQNGELISELEKIGHQSALLGQVNSTQS